MGGSHDHSHDHGHGHGHHRSSSARRMALTLGLVVLYMIAEIVGGIWTNSLALLADAGHMLSDAASLGLALFAMWMAGKPATSKRTFGFYRTEILAALLNGAALVAISFYIFWEAWKRLAEPPEVLGPGMMAIAVGGLVVNVVGLFVLHGSREESLNVEGAFLHVLTDALGSVGAIVAGALVWAFGWQWADPVASAVIGLLVLYSSWSLLVQTVHVLMEGAPGHVDVDELRRALVAVDGVADVHDLHVWTITSGLVAMSAHVVVVDHEEPFVRLERLRNCVREGFKIQHVTLQLELEGQARCDLPV